MSAVDDNMDQLSFLWPFLSFQICVLLVLADFLSINSTVTNIGMELQYSLHAQFYHTVHNVQYRHSPCNESPLS